MNMVDAYFCGNAGYLLEIAEEMSEIVDAHVVWGSDRGDDWRRRFEGSKKAANSALSRRDISTVLSVVFDRLYTLRNQIFHGGTTHPSGFGLDQIRDGSRIIASLVPAILEIMRQDIDANPDSELWGKVAFPRIQRKPE